MSLPTLTKTWSFTVNQAQSALGTADLDARTMLLAIINQLITYGWTVYYSCNSVTAGIAGDGVNRLTTVANIVPAGAGTAHSWIVLKNTAMGTGNFQLLIEWNLNTGSGAGGSISTSTNAGFTGGTTTAGPTATDKIIHVSSSNFIPNADAAMRWSVSCSTDLQCTRVMWCSTGSVRAVWVVDQCGSPDVGITYPVAVSIQTSSTTPVTTTATVFSVNPTDTAAGGNASIGFESALIALTVPNDFNSSWPMAPCTMVGTSTSLHGRIGLMQDFYIGAASIATGDSYPATGTLLQFIQVGQWIFPWNQGNFNLS